MSSQGLLQCTAFPHHQVCLERVLTSGVLCRCAVDGYDVQTAVPPQRWDVDASYDPSSSNKHAYVRFGGWLDDVQHFDPAAFRMSQR